ncbi:hypothetical protein B296_00007201 [Ensete ventricosum]|uniref:Uncharacterized protein n=1 Tax=Ensete ventricosum TaxID=4639 RepID=A0A426ZLF0_ENSVE|nr:hypothetical protein B296_00007201 [Ensete ventricosum]
MTEGGQRAILAIEIRKTESWKKKMEEIEVTSHHQREGAYNGKPHFTNRRSTSRSGAMTLLGKHVNRIKCDAQQGSRDPSTDPEEEPKTHSQAAPADPSQTSLPLLNRCRRDYSYDRNQVILTPHSRQCTYQMVKAHSFGIGGQRFIGRLYREVCQLPLSQPSGLSCSRLNVGRPAPALNQRRKGQA